MKMKLSPSKGWELKPGATTAFKAAALKAMKMLHHRIYNQNKDSNMRPLPRLGLGRAWFFFSIKDPRWEQIKTGKVKKRSKKDREARAHLARTLFFRGGYREAKKITGGRPRRDGRFSGSMWRSLTPQVKKTKKGVFLKLYFAGGTRTHESAGTKTVKGKRVIQWRTESVRNRVKAYWMQCRTRKGSGKPAFALMRFSDAEMKVIVREILPGYEMNGKKLSQGQSSRFPSY